VGVSTTGTDPADFTIISGTTYVEAPIVWTEYVYDLSAYAGQQIHVGLQCVSYDAFIFFVDDFYVGDAIVRTASNAASIAPDIEIVRNANTRRSIVTPNPVNIVSPQPRNTERSLQGYKVYRLLAEDQANEANWDVLTPSVYGQTTYADNAWGPLPSGVYKFAVKAVYTNNVMSPAAFSAELHKGMMGTLTGTVTEFGTELPVEGATVTAGEYSGTTNAQGVYSFAVYAGTYSVTAAKAGYQSSTQDNIVIVGTQTTTTNFTLTEITLPPAFPHIQANLGEALPQIDLNEYFYQELEHSYYVENEGAFTYQISPEGILNLYPPLDWYGTQELLIGADYGINGSYEQILKISILEVEVLAEDFDHAGVPPSGWSINHSGSTDYPWAPLAISGSNYAMQTRVNAGKTANERLLSTAYNFSELKDIEISFDSDLLLYPGGSASLAYSVNNITYNIVA
ncbi:MAG TPA: carboxypeptidase regulatory-like domain-containing protein, partial [Candidatus Cloacimonadota bacterium]|nr:carboxypeptidase regulatory-like domain-containing protein [Candidatus Cloacimonadota bacterium]